MTRNIKARIHSKNGEMDDVVIISENGYNDVLVSYKGNICTAIFNPFVCAYYVDDKYGVIGPDPEKLTKTNMVKEEQRNEKI